MQPDDERSRFLRLKRAVEDLVISRNIEPREPVDKDVLRRAYNGHGFSGTLFAACEGIAAQSLQPFVQRAGRDRFLVIVRELDLSPRASHAPCPASTAGSPNNTQPRSADGAGAAPRNGASHSRRQADMDTIPEAGGCVLEPRQGHDEPIMTSTGAKCVFTIQNVTNQPVALAAGYPLILDDDDNDNGGGGGAFAFENVDAPAPSFLMPWAMWSVLITCSAKPGCTRRATVIYEVGESSESLQRSIEWTLTSPDSAVPPRQNRGDFAWMTQEGRGGRGRRQQRADEQFFVDEDAEPKTRGELPLRDDKPDFVNKITIRPRPHPTGRAALIAILENTPDALENYALRAHALLDLEELAQMQAMREYDNENATFDSKDGNILCLTVPGLPDKKPSVLVGNAVRMRMPDGGDDEHEGYVHDIEGTRVYLSFHASVVKQIKEKETKVFVRFLHNRLPTLLCHRAVDVADEDGTLQRLFPSGESDDNVPEGEMSTQGQLNTEQAAAVSCILAMRAPRTTPFFLFGPPGTGKTTTIVEAIVRLLRRNPRILVCAPSNSAADLLLFALKKRVPDNVQFLRVQARGRPLSAISAEHRDVVRASSTPFCNRQGFPMPTLNEVCSKSVVVTTLSTSAALYSLGVPRGHFTHVFVDEAAQAHEPEVLCCLAGIASQQTQIILAGDHKQLGPVVQCKHAGALGLSKSLIERLMETPAFTQARGHFVKLVQNYRAHADLVRVPSELFYGGDLIARASHRHEDLLAFKPGHRFPVHFHHVQGVAKREGRSKSLFNVEEIAEVKRIIEDLTTSRRFRSPVEPKDIAVISPYYKQVSKMRGEFASWVRAGLRVGSVEQFQGGEARVVLLTTVRSPDCEEGEQSLGLSMGFLRNERRFNVAITRAMSLLVIVGCEAVLETDANWRTLIDWARSRGASLP